MLDSRSVLILFHLRLSLMSFSFNLLLKAWLGSVATSTELDHSQPFNKDFLNSCHLPGIVQEIENSNASTIQAMTGCHDRHVPMVLWDSAGGAQVLAWGKEWRSVPGGSLAEMVKWTTCSLPMSNS